ncbi:MAG: hypothetical protein ACLQFR_22675 [Streptosporangiaceae bacterium]
MCSNTSPTSPRDPSPADLAARLSGAIDELAAAVSRGDFGCSQLAERLARTWGMITDADPELASRAARY